MSKRVASPEIIPGESITRFFLDMPVAGGPFDIHVAHHPDGDLAQEAQWYGIYESPDDHQLQIVQDVLHIDDEDWSILTQVIGSFHWALFHHPLPPHRSEIRIDEAALRGNEWTTAYF